MLKRDANQQFKGIKRNVGILAAGIGDVMKTQLRQICVATGVIFQSQTELIITIEVGPHAGHISKAIHRTTAAKQIGPHVLAGGKGITGQKIDAEHRRHFGADDQMDRQLHHDGMKTAIPVSADIGQEPAIIARDKINSGHSFGGPAQAGKALAITTE